MRASGVVGVLPVGGTGLTEPNSALLLPLATRSKAGSSALLEPVAVIRAFSICRSDPAISGRFLRASATRSCSGSTGSCAGGTMVSVGMRRSVDNDCVSTVPLVK